MTPNLTRLFDLANPKIPMLESEEMISAMSTLQLIFERHGEALIAALEKLANEADGFSGLAGPVIVGHTNMKVLKDRIASARQLLAQLESEAQP